MIFELVKRYAVSVYVLAFALTGVAAAAERPAAAQEWEATVKRAEEEGQIAVYATDSIGHAQVIWAACGLDGRALGHAGSHRYW